MRKPGRARRVLGWVSLIVLVATAVAVYVARPRARLDAWAKEKLRAEVATALGRPTVVSSVHVSPLAGRIEIRDLTVGAKAPSSRTVLTIPRLSVAVSWWSLLRGRLEMKRVNAERPVVSVWREAGEWEGPFPRASRERARLEIVLERLDVSDGVLAFEDRELPLWFRAEAARALWTSKPTGGGKGTFDSEKLSVGDGFPALAGTVHIEGTLAGTQASANGTASWGGNRLRLEGSAQVPPRPGTPLTGEVRASFEAQDAAQAPLLPTLVGRGAKLSGRLEATALVRLTGWVWSAEGRVHGESVRFADLEASTVDADVAMTASEARIRNLTLHTLGGIVRGDVDLAPRKGGEARAKVAASDLSLPEVLKTGGLDTGLDGRVSGEGTVSARLGEMASLRGTGVFRVTPTGTASRRGRLDAEAAGEIRMDGAEVIVTAPAARVGPTTASLDVRRVLDPEPVRLKLNVTSGSLGDTAELVAALLYHGPGKGSLPFDPSRLSGRGKASGELVLEAGRPPSGSVEFAVEDFAYAGVGADSVSGTLMAAGGELTLRDTIARKGGGTLRIEEGRLPREPGAPWRFAGSFDRWPADDILAVIGVPGEASAKLAGSAEIGGDGLGRTGSAVLSITDAKAGPLAFESGSVEAALRDSVIRISRLDLKGPAGSVNAAGSYDLEESRLTGTLEASHVDASLAGPYLRNLPVTGRVALSLRGEARGGTIGWSATISPDPQVLIAGKPLEDFSIAAEGDSKQARVTARLGPHARIEGSVALAAPHESSGSAELDAVQVASLVEYVRAGYGSVVGGEVTGRITWSGPLDDPGSLRAQAELEPLRIAVGTESFTAPRPARISLAGGLISFDDVTLVSGASRVDVGGTYPLDPSRALLDLWIDSSADISALTAFVPGLSSAGTLTVAVRATGSSAAPDLTGTARLVGGRIRMAGQPLLSVDRLEAEARIENDAITIDRISGIVSGGTLAGNGRVAFQGLEPSSLVLTGKVAAATLEMPEGFRGVYTGDLTFEAERGKVPSLSGRIDLVRGVWRKNFELDRVNLLARTRVPMVEVPTPDEGIAKTTLDIDIDANENLWIRNDLSDAEARGRVEVRGTIGHPRISGHVEALPGGELRFGAVRYQLDSARVEIPQGPPLNPQFDIVASTRVRDYDIRTHLWGDTTRVESELSSTPSLAERDILALLLTGSKTTEAGYQASAGTIEGSATNLVTGQIGTLVGSHLERWLGFEEIRIDPYQYTTTGDPTTRITLGKRLFPKVFVRTSIPLNTTVSTTYEVEYQASRTIRFSAFRGDQDALGGVARYSGRTWSPYANSRRREATRAAPRAGEKVSEVRFLGSIGEEALRLARLVPLRAGGDFNRRELTEGTIKLKRHYVKEGYLEASVTASTENVEGGGVRVDYAIDRGPKVNLVLTGAGDSERKIRRILVALWLEPSISAADVEDEARERIRSGLRSDGYYNGDVRVESQPTAAGKKLIFHIDRGEKVRISSIVIVGASAIPKDEVLRQVLSGRETRFRKEVLKPEMLDQDVANVENFYRSRGYLSVRAKSAVSLEPRGRYADVAIEITEGPRARLRSIEIRGNRAIPESRLRGLVRSRADEPFDAVAVYEDLQRLRALYDTDGYLDAKVEEDLRSDGENVDLAYVISEGERKTFQSVQIEGNRFTHGGVIRRLVPLREGEPISHEKLQKIQTDLTRTGLFSEVQVSWADAPGGTGGQILTITVREANDLLLGAGVGYDTYNGPRVNLDVAEANVLGTGWYTGLSVLYGSKVRREQLTFRAPRAVRGWVPIFSAIHDIEVRDTFTQAGTAASAALERKTAGSLTHIIRYSASLSNVYDLTVPEETFHATEPRLDLGQIRLASLGYAIARDERDNPLNTTRGSYLSGDLRVFSEILGSQQRFAKLFLQGSLARPLRWHLVGATSMRIGLASRLGSPNPLPLQERYFAGGPSTFRGFRQDGLGYVDVKPSVDAAGKPILVDTGTLEHGTLRPLGGETVFLLNTELRRPIYGSLSAVIFWDSGNVFPKPEDFRLGRFRNTLGTGVRIDTPIGPVRVEFGWKVPPRANESTGEYVLTIGQTF